MDEKMSSSPMTSMDEMMASDEIDLADEDEEDINQENKTTNEKTSSQTFNTMTNEPIITSATSHSTHPSLPSQTSKAILSTSSSITSSANETLKTSLSNKPENESVSGEVMSKNNSSDHYIEVSVGEPQKVGDGMGAYVVYKVSTKTNLPYFRKSLFAVNRRFSDFLGLHDKLAEKHLHLGRIIPPAPEKNAVGMAKVKMSKDESSVDFIEKRRAALERYLKRNAAHPILCADPDFREFLELDTDLPKATNTSALSGAGVKRLLSRVGDTVNKMTFRMDESDPVLLYFVFFLLCSSKEMIVLFNCTVI
jgi:sorting nexin-1/2